MRWLFVLVLSSACVRAVREERREQAVDTGALMHFSAEGPRRWDFGDGSPGVTGSTVAHGFARAGRYEVKAFDAEQLTDRISVLVQTRDPFRAVAPSAEAVLVFRSIDELGPAVDFLERLASPAAVQRLLERAPLLAFGLDAEGAALDRLEGAGLFLPGGLEASVSFIGVHDEAAAVKAFGAFLVDRGFTPARDVPGRFELDGTRGIVFVDRGTLFFATGGDWRVLDAAVQSVKEAPPQGFEADPGAAEGLAQLASGGVAVVVRPRAAARAPWRSGAALWRLGLAALRFGRNEARLAGRLVADGPLWKTPAAGNSARLLANAPDAPMALLAADVPANEVLEALGLSLDEEGVVSSELRVGLELLSRRLDFAAYFDVERFIAATVAHDGRPSPRFTLLAESAAPDRLTVKSLVTGLLSRHRAEVHTAQEGPTQVWRTTVLEGEPLELVLDAQTLYARIGRALAGHAPENFVGVLSRRAEGACGPGHVTAFLDVGQLSRDLLEPRMVPGVDPRRVVMTQALTSTFLSQMTAVETVFADLAPSSNGATLFAEVTLTRRANEGPPP